MHDQGHRDDPDLLKRMGYETRDVRITPLVKALIWLGVSLVVAQVVGWAVQAAFINRPGEGRVGRSVMSAQQVPPAPLLQVEPKREMRDLNRAAQSRLSSYGIDSRTGARHIPIERAMQIVAEEGLNPPPGDATNPVARQIREPSPGVELERPNSKAAPLGNQEQ